MRALRFLSLLAVLLVVMPLWSCNGDEDNPAKPKSPYKSLAADQPRDNGLFNLQYSCNERNIEHYEELLDQGFVFHFSPEDVLNGYPSDWSRAAEINANTNMFDPNYSNPIQEPAQDIDLSLVYPEGDDEWTPIEPEDQVTYPGETWYQKIVTYNLVVQLPGNFQYVGLNKQAAFVLRAATAVSGQVWRIVVWRDDTGTLLRDGIRRGHASAITEETTWGQVKALYSE
jgi:hypothetical protein